MTPKQNDRYPIMSTVTEAQPAPIVHDAGSGVTYRGYANLGTAVTEASWKISRTTVAAGVTLTEYADGNMEYDNIWNNRASLTYSR